MGGGGGGGGGWLEEFGNNANSIQLQLPTGTELGNNDFQATNILHSFDIKIT